MIRWWGALLARRRAANMLPGSTVEITVFRRRRWPVRVKRGVES